MRTRLVGLVAAFLLLGCGWSAAPALASEPFVTARPRCFELAGREHRFVGTNFWQGMNLGVDGPSGDRARLAAELDDLRRLGITNLRVLAGSEAGSEGADGLRLSPALMTAPGVYDERVLDGLDYLIAEAGRRDLHVVLVLTNFWGWSGGMAQYVAWAEGSAIPEPPPGEWLPFGEYAARFYTNSQCQAWYRAHIATLVNRVNRYTGRQYRDEPAIFAWELANEPRLCPAGWIDASAGFIKSLDPHHLVTTGSEGSIAGDFRAAHASPHVDYATVHIWPQNWGWYDPREPATFPAGMAEALKYLRGHYAIAADLGKPIVLEEFGLARDWQPLQNLHNPRAPTGFRDRLFAALLGEVAAAATGGGTLAGSNFWVWSGHAQPGQPWVGDPPHEPAGWYSVYASDATTRRVLMEHVADLAPWGGGDFNHDGVLDLRDLAEMSGK